MRLESSKQGVTLFLKVTKNKTEITLMKFVNSIHDINITNSQNKFQN
jgi:hypothetical protein